MSKKEKYCLDCNNYYKNCWKNFCSVFTGEKDYLGFPIYNDYFCGIQNKNKDCKYYKFSIRALLKRIYNEK